MDYVCCTYNGFVKLLLNKFKNMRNKHKKIEVLRKSKLSSNESIILKAIQESNISKKGYAFINDELNRCSKLKQCIKNIKSS